MLVGILVIFCFVEFHMIVCGLDNIIARRWINGMLVCCNYLFVILMDLLFQEVYPEMTTLYRVF